MTLRAPLILKIILIRFIFFLSVWLMIAGWNREDIAVGLAACALALWVSLRLLPATGIRPHIAPLVKLNLRFLGSSIMAGVDVSRRALSPRINLNPGFATVPLTLPPGIIRNVFLAYQSLQPGTSPTSAEGDVIDVHCLDVSQPVAAAVSADEALFKKAIGYE